MKITDLKKQNGNFTLNIENDFFENKKIHGIIGANGSGKSTLAKLIIDIIPKDSGEIDFEDITSKQITLTTQKPYLLHTSVYNNLIYPLKIRKQNIDDSLVDYWLEKTGLVDKKKQYALSLSSGEQQKLSFARAMIFKPKLVIIDETLSNLDPDSVTLFENIILEQQAKDPITFITISHQLVHIKKICDVVHFMQEGKIVATDTPQNLLINPKHDSVIKYLASTEVSFNKGNA